MPNGNAEGMMNGLRKSDFDPHVSSTFEVRPAGMPKVLLELVEVKDSSSATMDAFSLIFKGGFEAVFRHDTHLMTHPTLGELELFIGPVHTGKTDAVYYQALFNTLKR